MPIDKFFTSQAKIKFRRPQRSKKKLAADFPSTVKLVGQEANHGYEPARRKWDQPTTQICHECGEEFEPGMFKRKVCHICEASQ